MVRVNAMEEQFEEVEILGKPALFTPSRIERGTVPCGYHLYEVRHDDDCQGDAVQIARNIYVNHWGSLITLYEIDIPVDGLLDIEPDDMNYGAGGCCTMSEYMVKYPAKGNYIDRCECYIHSLKKGGQSQLAEATIIEKIGDNLYLADYNGVRCTAIFNPFVCRYYVDDPNGLRVETKKSVYIRNGYEDRADYLASLADRFGADLYVVSCLADVLGESEDFDGLVSELEDIAYLGLV